MTTDAKIFIIEDTPDYLERIRSRLTKKGYQYLTTSTTLKDAQEKLSKHYDVIIADMRLGEESAGGFAIVDEIKRRNITSIVIILTANDSVLDCRKALRSGVCWDYIPKTMAGSSLEELCKSIQDGLTHRDNRHDAAWIDENNTTLLEKYADKYIAVINRQVIFSAETREKVKTELEKLHLPLFVTVIRKVEAQSPHNLSVSELINWKENDKLEFKSTLQWDIREQKKNDTLRFSILKTITAFFNSNGGTLIIGIEDDGTIFGLEKDFSFCKKQNDDGFELLLRDLISENLGASFSASEYVKVRFEVLDGKTVCAVDTLKAPSPVFLSEPKNGQKLKQYYIRRGNGSCALDVEQMYKYLTMRREI